MSESTPIERPVWASRSTSDDPSEALRTFEEGLPVRLIMTPREHLSTCHKDEKLAAVVERNRADQFDFLPVTERLSDGDMASDRIIGIVEVRSLLDGEAVPQGSVSSRIDALSEGNLIGADGGILSFVRNADQQRVRLVVSGRRISGLVSLSDLQKLPVRAALFAIVTHLEMTMADAIRRECNGEGEWLKRLTPGRRSKIQGEIGKSKTDDTYVDALLFTQFADKRTIIQMSPRLAFDQSVFEDQLKDIELLRNLVAHANDYATTPAAAQRVCQTVRLIDDWIKNLAAWPEQVPV